MNEPIRPPAVNLSPTDHGPSCIRSIPCRLVRWPTKSPHLLVLWLARAVWLVVAVIGGGGFGEALARHSREVQLTGTTLLWIGWATVAVALAVPAVVGLTISRMTVPMGTVAAGAAVVHAGASAATILAIVSTALASLVMASGEFGQAMAQASAYGDEERFPLRPPAAFYAPSAVSWSVLCACALIGPLALAGRGWFVGTSLTVFAAALAWFLIPRFHRLSRRWVVLVPAGLVFHDHVVLAETVMFPARIVRGARLALVDTEAADLTGPAGGHAVEISLSESTTVVLAGTRANPGGRALHVMAFLLTPTRPGRLLRSMGERSIAVG